MMTSVRKTRSFASACEVPFRTLVLVTALVLLAGCSHTGVLKETGLGTVELSIDAPSAREVDLVIMRSRAAKPGMVKIMAQKARQGGGTWSVKLDLIPGEYRYFFMVDGVVTDNGLSGRVEKDGFGGVTGVLTVYRTPEGPMGFY